jgi:hypothetical protein
MMLVNIVKVIETVKYNHNKRMYTGEVAVIDNNFVVSRYTSRVGEMTFVVEGVITCTAPKNIKVGDKLFYDKDIDKFTNNKGILVGRIKSVAGVQHFVVVHFGLEEKGKVTMKDIIPPKGKVISASKNNGGEKIV